MTTLWHQRRAQGLCGYCGEPSAHAGACDSCLSKRRPRYRKREAQRRDAARLAPGPNQIGCCGQMHVVPTLPCRLSCGHVVGLPRAPEAREEES